MKKSIFCVSVALSAILLTACGKKTGTDYKPPSDWTTVRSVSLKEFGDYFYRNSSSNQTLKMIYGDRILDYISTEITGRAITHSHDDENTRTIQLRFNKLELSNMADLSEQQANAVKAGLEKANFHKDFRTGLQMQVNCSTHAVRLTGVLEFPLLDMDAKEPAIIRQIASKDITKELIRRSALKFACGFNEKEIDAGPQQNATQAQSKASENPVASSATNNNGGQPSWVHLASVQNTNGVTTNQVYIDINSINAQTAMVKTQLEGGNLNGWSLVYQKQADCTQQTLRTTSMVSWYNSAGELSKEAPANNPNWKTASNDADRAILSHLCK